jgi:hypothetical protein
MTSFTRRRVGVTVFVATCAVFATASNANAQEQPSRDSLAVQVRRLQARLDSLERVLHRLSASGRDTAAAHDELAALRAAAAAAGGPPPDTSAATNRQFVDQSRSQPKLNPEISATGDVRVLAQGQGPQTDNVDVREFELALQSPLDPFSNTKIFLTFSDEEIGIEEGYAYWTGLPGHIRLDVGRFRQQFGELNRWHAHELPWSEYPLAIREYLGSDGLGGDGVSAYWLVPAGGGALGAHEVFGQVTLANNETLFAGGTHLAFMGHLNNFWSLSPATFVQVGGSVLYGENPDSALKSATYGVDFRLNWRPPLQGSYRSFTLRAEGFATRHAVADVGDTRYGGYVGAQYQLTRRLFAGLRYDHVQLLQSSDVAWTVVPNLTWWQSEWVYVRGEWQHDSMPLAAGARDVTNRFLVQIVWAIGPHKHETY